MTKMDDKEVNNVVEQLLKEVEKVFGERKKLTNELMQSLHFIFGKPLPQALDLVDKHNVKIIQSCSGRRLYQITGSVGTPYVCFRSSNYCSCPAYTYSVLKKQDYIMCKHVLAAKLSDAMGLCDVWEVGDETMAQMIFSLD
ncbi:ZSWIM7 (predicted) [Pycnogonum litorale]